MAFSREIGRYLSCRDCQTDFRFPAELFVYTDAASPAAAAEETLGDETGDAADILLRPIWCHACNAPSFEEDVPQLAEFTLALTLLRDRTKPVPRTPAGEPFESQLMMLGEFQGIEAVQRLGARMINRTPSRRCLMCGSPSFTRVAQEWRNSLLKHEECGGTLGPSWTIGGSIPRRPIVNTIRYFAWDGSFRWAIKFTWPERTPEPEWEIDPVQRFD